MNMLRLVETVNMNNNAVRFPVEKSIQLSEDAVAASLVTSLKGYNIRAVKVGKGIVVRFRSVDDVNTFARLYFPVLFTLSRSDAEANDKKIRRTFKDVISGLRPSPHRAAVEDSIRTIINRLAVAGVDVDDMVKKQNNLLSSL